MKIIFLKLDNVICKSKSGFSEIMGIEDIKIIPEAKKAIEGFKNWKKIGLTNAKGLRWGKSEINDYVKGYQKIIELFPALDKICACIDYGDTCLVVEKNDYEIIAKNPETIKSKHLKKRVKKAPDIYEGNYILPDIGMIKLIFCQTEKVEESLYIGENNTDFTTAKNAEIPFIYAKDWHQFNFSLRLF